MAGATEAALAAAVAAVAEEAGCEELLAAVRAAESEAGVLAAIASTATDDTRMPLLRAGLCDAVVDHAADGFAALPATGQALVLRTPGAVEDLLEIGHAAAAHPLTTTVDSGLFSFGPSEACVRAACRTARASPGVRDLVLHGDDVPPDHLARSLEDVVASPWLASLELDGGTITDTVVRALASVFRPEGGLDSLNVHGGTLDVGATRELVRSAGAFGSLERLTVMHCHGGSRLGDGLGAILDASGSITRMTVANTSLGGDEGVASLLRGLGRNTSLTELTLGLPGASSHAAADMRDVLAANTTMWQLTLSLTGTSPGFVADLSQGIDSWRGPASLRLIGSAVCGEEAVALGEALQQSTCLTRVHLSQVRASPAGLASLVAALGSRGGSVSELTLIQSKATADHFEAAMAAARAARPGSSLSLRCLEGAGLIADAAGRHLPHCPGLHGMSIGGHALARGSAQALCEAVGAAPWLTRLQMEHVALCARGVEALAAGIKACTGLTSLGLSSCDVIPGGWSPIVCALGSVPSLSCLHLRGGPGDEDAPGLAAAFSRWHHSLTDLSLAACEIGPQGMVSVAGALAGCSALRSLGLSSVPTGDAGMAALAKALRGCTGLTRLGCRNSRSSDEAAAQLLETARGLSSLTDLSTGNWQGADAATAHLVASRNREGSMRRRRWARRRSAVLWRRAAKEAAW